MLSFLFGRAEEDHEVAKVEAQTEKSHEAGTIWNAIREADVEAVQSIVESLHGGASVEPCATQPDHARPPALNHDAYPLRSRAPDYSRLIDDRGPVGDTVLHLCFLYNSDRHKEIAHWLIDRCPELLLTQYTGPLYYGTTRADPGRGWPPGAARAAAPRAPHPWSVVVSSPHLCSAAPLAGAQARTASTLRL